MSASRPFFTRIATYFREMFPVLVYLPYVVALYLCLNVASQAIANTEIVIDGYGVVGMVSALCMMILMRTFDDLKDVAIDKVLFPERAIPRGDVKVEDVKLLSVTSFTVLIIVNFFAPKTWFPFAIMMVYALLTFKWFFAEAIHRKNLFLTMLTHQPVPLFINFYLVKTALAATGHPFGFRHLLLLLMFTLPVTAWETGRKTRAPGSETDYVTFSRIFGPRTSAFISLSCLLMAGLFCTCIGYGLKLNHYFTFPAICFLLIGGIVFVFGRFILHPTDRNNLLKNATLAYTTILFLNMLIHMLLQYSVKVRL